MNTPLSHAQSLLFVPATRLDRLDKALASGTHAVIIDLEDAVAPDAKAAARQALAELLVNWPQAARRQLLVRINAVGTPWHEDDLDLVAQGSEHGLGGVMLAKSERVDTLQDLAARVDPATALVPLIESLAGLDAADALARQSGVTRLAFGHLDFQLDLGMRCSPEENELLFARNALVCASRRASLAPPIDGVTVATGDLERLQIDTRRARALGFGGKLCIHPAQIDTVNQTFAPSQAELDWARRVASAAQEQGTQAFSLDGKMVDAPVIRAAERLLRT